LLSSRSVFQSTQPRLNTHVPPRSFSLVVDSSTTAETRMDLPHKTSVAYAITVTDCTPTIFDAAAVLAKSIRTTQQHYSYDLIAILHHVQARDCQQGLEYLGYQVMLKDVPFRLEELKARNRIELGRGGCCGISEYLKLYTVSLTQYDVVTNSKGRHRVLKHGQTPVLGLTLPKIIRNLIVFNFQCILRSRYQLAESSSRQNRNTRRINTSKCF
jgi:hypothetical protein